MIRKIKTYAAGPFRKGIKPGDVLMHSTKRGWRKFRIGKILSNGMAILKLVKEGE